jgi:phage tail-like protein
MNRAYRFATDAHWHAGASRGFGGQIDGLVAQQPVAACRLGRNLAHILASPVGCGQIRLLDRRNGEVWTRYPSALEMDGRLDGIEQPFAFAANATWLWVGQKGSLLRFDASTLRLAGELEMPGLWAITPDRFDGVWAFSGNGQVAQLHHVDSWGRPSARAFDWGSAVAEGTIAGAPTGDWVVTLALSADIWTLTVIDLNSCRIETVFEIEGADPHSRPTIAIDELGSILILLQPDRLVRYSRTGVIAADDELQLGQASMPVAGLFSADGELVVVAADGLYGVEPAPPNSEADRTSVFITPGLVSPEGTPSGWNRADIDVDLPVGTSIRVSVVASSSQGFVRAVGDLFASRAMTPAERFNAIDSLIPWKQWATRDRTYHGTGKRARLHFLLDQLPEAHLWLRLEATTSPGSNPPVLHAIDVRYPDQSWLDELPAIYRENESSAAQLRRFLAPLEVVFDELDASISRLPADIHPETAPATRLDELLCWLGFPSTAELGEDVQRDLLRKAGTLLARRGTLDALRELLAIVTRNRADVQDSATEAFLWMLGPSRAGRGARLGFDTRAVPALPRGFRVAKTKVGGGVLGNDSCLDIAGLALGACATIRIRITARLEERTILEPIVAALCAVFVPAHCRIDVQYLPPGALNLPPLLDDTAMLKDDQGDPLGADSRIGSWQLPTGPTSILSLDAHAELSGDRRLA